MTISQEEVAKVAKLARLCLSDQEVLKYTEELDKILDYVGRLNQIDTSNIEPLTHAISASTKTPVREDKPDSSEILQEFRNSFLDLAPQTEGKFIKVPKI